MDQCIVTCLTCRKARTGLLPIYCSCGNIIGKPSPRKLTHADICRTNVCGHYKDNSCQLFIENMRQQGKIVGGSVDYLISHPKVRCPMTTPMWFVGDVGFLSVSYMKIGGTETFHRTLLPGLKNVAGFVTLNKDLADGDFSLLGCQYGIGLEAAKRLASSVKVLVAWGIGDELGNILADLPQKPKVVSVSHCDARSEWTNKYMNKQEPYTNKFVHINQHGLATIPEHRRQDAVLIPNGVDKKRTSTTHTREQIRTKYGIPENAKLGVMITRYSEEKGIREGMAAARVLGHHLLVVGNATFWNESYLRELKSLETDKVRLVEEVDNPADVLIAADYYLSLSVYEGFGLSMAEAMAMGIPVISTPVGVVEDDPNLATIVSLKPFTEDVVQAIQNQQDTAAYAKQQMETNYNSELFVSRWQELLNELAGVQIPIRNSVPNIHPLSCSGYIG